MVLCSRVTNVLLVRQNSWQKSSRRMADGRLGGASGAIREVSRGHCTMRRFLLFMALVVVLAGCSHSMRPDLERLYSSTATNWNQPPVVLIHGILGARLRDRETKQEKWPGSIWNILLSDYRDLSLDIDSYTLRPRSSEIEAYDITDQAAGQDFYGAIIRTLALAGGYHQGTLGVKNSMRSRNYYVFYYDWRYDNVDSARALDRFISQIQDDYGDPNLKVDIVAHSMGGLLTRYYIRYGTQDVLNGNEFNVTGAGGEKVRKVVLLGTPNFGSLSAVQSLTVGHQIGLTRIPPEVLATMPSIYQLLPHALNSWMVTTDGKPLERDIFDTQVWRAFQWSVFDPEVEQRVISSRGSKRTGVEYLETLQRFFEKSLERARRFTWSLSVPEGDCHVEYIVFGGSCLLTPARIVVEEREGDSAACYFPSDIQHKNPQIDYFRLMLEPGDGLVTKSSLLARDMLDPAVPRHHDSFFPLHSSIFLCEKHDQLTGNINFQDNLLQALLSQ